MQPPEQAHNMLNALATIEAQERSLPAEKQACAVLRKAIANLGEVSQSVSQSVILRVSVPHRRKGAEAEGQPPRQQQQQQQQPPRQQQQQQQLQQQRIP
jgi:hypothetical protein